MAENTKPGQCTDAEWDAAVSVGLPYETPGTNAFDAALHKYTERMQLTAYAEGRADQAAEVNGGAADGNHWTVFNGAGAVVCDNMPLDVARAYLTPERAERGWNAVYCIVVRDPADFPAIAAATTAPESGCDYCRNPLFASLKCPGCGRTAGEKEVPRG